MRRDVRLRLRLEEHLRDVHVALTARLREGRRPTGVEFVHLPALEGRGERFHRR